MTNATRTETDSLGTIEIPANRYWGPQTERARQLFRIGDQRFPAVLIRAVGLHKIACAEANEELGELPAELAGPIRQAAQEIADGSRDDEFPLPIWQTGSGTQTNMNANEVIANRANELLGQARGSRTPVHPNDHVNRSQSSNDNFPTIMHIAAAEVVERRLIPALGMLHAALARRAAEWANIVKVGRTHMMDAVPMTLGQACGAWARQVELGQERLRETMPRLLSLAQGGTAVGTGLNRPPGFDTVFCRIIAARTGLAFVPNPNKFEGMGAHDALGRTQRTAQCGGRFAQQTWKRCAPAWQWPKIWPWRADRAGRWPVLVHHAGQDEPDPIGSADDGVRPGDREPHDGDGRRGAELSGAERVQAGNHSRRAGIGRPAGRRRRKLRGQHGRQAGAEPRPELHSTSPIR